jgi:hypothetical protein
MFGVLLITAVVGLIVFAGGSWIQVTTSTSPSPRWMIQMAFNPMSQRLVLFGGCPANDVALNDQWEYDGSNWIRMNPSSVPPTRYSYGMAYDSHRGVIVLFGGEDWPTLRGDTWEYDGATWRQINTPHAPISRAHFGMAYDSIRREVVLFGGWHWYVDQGETWTYNGTDWSLKSPSHSPVQRQANAMAFDESRGVVVMYGGTRQYASQGGPFSDTWEWDGVDWTERFPASSPGTRTYHQMTYDSARGEVILYGGGRNDTLFMDIWRFDGTNWTLVEDSSAPGARTTAAFSYFPPKGTFVRFGGRLPAGAGDNSTWEFNVNQAPVAVCVDAVKPAGADCQAWITAQDVNGGSYDPDGDPIELSIDNTGPFPIGESFVTLTVHDDKGLSSSCTAKVTVEDKTPPVIASLTVTPEVIWPPNHKLVPVTIKVTASDACGGDVQARILRVESDEPENGTGDGDTAPDWEITGDLGLKLRAERAGTGIGRTYLITVECKDKAQNAVTGVVQVFVPHSKGR